METVEALLFKKENVMRTRTVLSNVLSICVVLMVLTSVHGSESQGKRPKEITLELAEGIDMQAILIPAGKFQMGFQEESEKFYTLALPGRQVTIS